MPQIIQFDLHVPMDPYTMCMTHHCNMLFTTADLMLLYVENQLLCLII